MNSNIIHFIKKELTLFIISLSIFSFAFYLYNSQSSFNKKEEIESLKQQIINQKKKLKKDIEEYNKEKEFEKTIKGLKIIDKPITLDIYKVEKKLKKDFFTFFGTYNIKINYNPDKISVKGIKKYVFYKVDIAIPYLNKYQIINYFNYLTSIYFYTIKSLSYNTKSQVFKITFYILGKKGKPIKKRRRRF